MTDAFEVVGELEYDPETDDLVDADEYDFHPSIADLERATGYQFDIDDDEVF